MAESEEIAGLTIGFSANVKELEESLAAARASLNKWLAAERAKQIKIHVLPVKDQNSFNTVRDQMEKELKAIADASPNVKISLQPSVESIKDSKTRIARALSPVTVEVVGKFVGWTKDGEPKITEAATGRGRTRTQAAAPAQPTPGAGDCCDDIVNAIKTLGTKLEALVNAGTGRGGGGTVTREKSAKTSPATAARVAAESAPSAASAQAAASATPPSRPASRYTCLDCEWEGPANQAGLHKGRRQHRDAIAAKASGAAPGVAAQPPAPRQAQPPKPARPAPTTTKPRWTNADEYVAAQSQLLGRSLGSDEEAGMRRVYEGSQKPAAKQAPVRPRAERPAVAERPTGRRLGPREFIPQQTVEDVNALTGMSREKLVARGAGLSSLMDRSFLNQYGIKGAPSAAEFNKMMAKVRAKVEAGKGQAGPGSLLQARSFLQSGVTAADVEGGPERIEERRNAVRGWLSTSRKQPEEIAAERKVTDPSARREADAARAAKYDQPWRCECGTTLSTSRPGKIREHKATAAHEKQMAVRSRTQQREARAGASPAIEVGAQTRTTPEAVAAYRASIGADTPRDLSQVPYRMPGYTPESQRYVRLPSVSEFLAKREGELAYADLSGMQSVGRNQRKGSSRRGTRLKRAVLNPFEEQVGPELVSGTPQLSTPWVTEEATRLDPEGRSITVNRLVPAQPEVAQPRRYRKAVLGGRGETQLAKDEAGQPIERLPGVAAYQALLAARRQIIEQRIPLTEEAQIEQRVRATGGDFGRSSLGAETVIFGKDLPEAERSHIMARVGAAKEETRRQARVGPQGGVPLAQQPEVGVLAKELGRPPTRGEVRQRMIELGQKEIDPLDEILADLGQAPISEKVDWEDLGWGDFDEKVRRAVIATGGERDDLVHEVLQRLGPKGDRARLDIAKLPSLQELDPDFENVLSAINKMVTGTGLEGGAPEFAGALAAIEPELRLLRATDPGLTRALSRGLVLEPGTGRGKAPPRSRPMQVQKRFMALNALRETARSGLQLGALGAPRPEGAASTIGELGRAGGMLTASAADYLGLYSQEPEKATMPTGATAGGVARRAWLSRIPAAERTTEQQAELDALASLRRSQLRATERGQRPMGAAGAARDMSVLVNRPVGRRYPPRPPEVRKIADERKAGIEWMARLFSYGDRTQEEEGQLTYLQAQHPRAVRTARDLYPAEEPEETEARKQRESVAARSREMRRMRTLVAHEPVGLSPLQKRELARLEESYPRVSNVLRGRTPISGGAPATPENIADVLRGELQSQVADLTRSTEALGMRGGRGRKDYEARATELGRAQSELGLVSQFFPEGKHADPLKRATEVVGRPPLQRRNRRLEAERQAASLILARWREEEAPVEEPAPPPAAATAPARAAQPRDAAGRFTAAIPTGVRYRGRYVAQQTVRDLRMRGNMSYEQAVANMHASGQLNASMRKQIVKQTGRSIEDIIASAGSTASAPAGAAQAPVAAGVGAATSPAAAAAATAARTPAAGAAGGGGGGGGTGKGVVAGKGAPLPAAGTVGVRYRSLNAILNAAREGGAPEERLASLQYQRDIGEVPDFPNAFQRNEPGRLEKTGKMGTLGARLLSARAGVAEQIQLTPVRALSVAFGQYAATLGARGGVRGRQIEFEAKSQQAQRALNLSEDAFSRRLGLREIIRTSKEGSDEQVRATEELKGVRVQHRVLKGRAATLTLETEKLAKSVSGVTTQFANLAFGTLGIVGGTLAFGASLAVGQALVGAVAEASKPLVEQITGYTERIRAVTQGLVQGALPTGDIAGTVAAQLSQAAVGPALAESLRAPLEARTQQGVQNTRLEQQIDLMRTAFQTQRDQMERPDLTNYRGLYQPMGGWNLPIVGQTNIGAQPSFLEQQGKLLQQQGAGDNAFNMLFRGDRSISELQRAASGGNRLTGGGLLPAWVGQPSPEDAQRQLDLLLQQSRTALEPFAGTRERGVVAVNADVEGFEGRPVDEAARMEQANLFRDIAPDIQDAIRGGQLVFLDEATGQVVTDLGRLDRAIVAAAEAFAKPSAGELLASMQRPLEAAVMGIQDNLSYALRTAQPANRALQRFVSPPLPFGFGMTGATGAAGAAQAEALAAFSGQAAPLMSQRAAMSKRDQAALMSIPGVEPAQVAQLQAYGTEIVRVQQAMASRQNALAGMQYNEQLRIARQQLGDILGLSGQIGAGEASRVGVLERQNMLIGRRIEDLGREAQAMQLAQSQRQINFQLATSRFTSAGATPAEAAANARYAEQQAAFAQTQLDIQKEIFGEQGRLIPNQREIQDTTIERQVEALENAINLMEEGFATQQFVAAGQSYLTTLEGANAALIEGMGAIAGAGQQMDLLRIQTTNQLFAQTGESVAIITDGVNTVFTDLLDKYDNFARRIQVPGFSYQPNAPANSGGSGGRGPQLQAAGWVGRVSSPVSMVVGEAGSEEVAILRNPRHMLAGMAGGGGGTVSVAINFNGEVNVREDGDIDRIALAVENLFNRKTELLGLRR